MIAACPKCAARYRVERERLEAGGVRLRCARCEAVFRVRPPAAPEPKPVPPPPAEPRREREAPVTAPPPAEPKRERETPVTPAAPPPPASPAPSARPAAELVLVAMPEGELARRTAEALARRGLGVLRASDGVEAMLEIQRKLPRAIVLAADLAKMFGFQICEVVKRNESLRGIWVVLVGAIHHAERYRRAPGELYGADAYVEGPELPEGLLPLLAQGGVALAPERALAGAGPPVPATPLASGSLRAPLAATTPPASGSLRAPPAAATPPASGSLRAPLAAATPPASGSLRAPLAAATPPASGSLRAPLAGPDPARPSAPPPAAAPPAARPAPPDVRRGSAAGSPAPALAPAVPRTPLPAADAARPVAPPREPARAAGARPAPSSRGLGAARAAPSLPLADGLDDERAKAERLARIVISDIVLYNDERFAAAVRAGNVLEAMSSDLAEGRQLFEERIDARVRAERDHLKDELLLRARARGTH